MTIKVSLLQVPGFPKTAAPMALAALGDSTQTQTFKEFQLQNGYGSATTATITPGYGATVSAIIDITVKSITEQTFKQVVDQVKTSSKYQSQSDFKQFVDSHSYASAASFSTGIFGWLLGSGSGSYTNQNTDLSQQINKYDKTDASSDKTVANSVANIILKNQSQVSVTATVQVTGQLLVPQPTIIAVETSTFRFTDQNGNSASVTLLNQSPLVPVNPNDSSVSQNTVTPGSKLAITPIGS
jgi:hypothetical protein